jgi:16S rRNA (uracil1498-N3)-methyltransferase
MRKHRFYLPQAIQINAKIILDKELSHYIIRVLRLPAHSVIHLFNNTGTEYAATLLEVTHNHVTVIINDAQDESLLSPINIHLAQVLGKGDKMDLIVQKATELGVTQITPLYSQHAVVRPVTERLPHKIEHWEKIAIAACAQSGRNTIPTINPPEILHTWFAKQNDDLKIILAPYEDGVKLKQLPAFSNLTLLIGPEGGFSDEELILAKRYNYTFVNLGARILRTETAAIASIAALQALYGDL